MTSPRNRRKLFPPSDDATIIAEPLKEKAKVITTEPIVISARIVACDLYRASSSQTKKTATATCGPERAAHNLAVRWFFGGCTKAAGVDVAEHQAVTVTKTGHCQFRATLKRSYVGKQSEERRKL